MPDPRDFSPIVPGGNSLGVRFKYQELDNKLLRETVQPDRDVVMGVIREQAKETQKNSILGGHQVASIPELDWHSIVLPAHPDLIAPDKEIRDRALIKFSNDPAMSIYKYRRA